MASDDDEIPETGAIFTFGKTRFAENLANKFWIRDDKVLQLACGDEHSAVITSSGRLYTFGSNDWGQLGHGNMKPYTKPSVVKKLKGDRVKVVACGRSHTLVVSESGVFSFGAGADSQLGHRDNKNYNIPTEIEALKEHTITQVACGAEHSAAVTDNGSLYVWGSGSEGQLGLGISECELPTLLKFRSKVTVVACGYYHTAVITELGKLYTFGDNEAGKLGLDDSQCDDTEQPQQVKTLNEPASSVACGGNHTAVVTKHGKLFTFGSGMHGQLGHGPSFQEVPLPKLVSAVQGKLVSAVSCGESHTAVLSKNGEMFTFGDGRHGKLGMGDESFSNLFKPTKVVRFQGFYVEQVSCGGCHMLAVAAKRHTQGSEGSEENGGQLQDDSVGEDVPDGEETSPRLSQTVPMMGMSARDKRRKKDTESIALASTLPPLNQSSLPPLASLGIANFKKEETTSFSNGRLNPLDRSMLPIISIKSPSPDEENASLSNSRRLPPRPKRRQKKPEPTSDSEEENNAKQRSNTATRPTPLPRRQKQVKEKEQDDADNRKKSQKKQKDRDTMEGSGSEASGEDSEEDNGNCATGSPSSSRNVGRNKEDKESEARHITAKDESEDGNEDEESEGGNDGKQEDKKGKVKENEKKKDETKEDSAEDEEEDEEGDEEEDEEGDEEEDEEEESEEDSEEQEDDVREDKATSSKTKATLAGMKESEEETEVTKMEAAAENGNDEDKKKEKESDKDSKKDKKDKKKKDKTKEEETDDKEKEEGKKKKKGKQKDKDKKEEEEDGNKVDGNEEDGDEDEGQEEKENEEDKNKSTQENDVAGDTSKDGKEKKTKKSGICVIL